MNDISVQAMRRLSTAGGVEMPAMDLSKPLSEPEKQLIRDAFLEHHILVFRNQKLSKEAQAAFTEQFGELEGHVVRQHDGSTTPQVHTVSNLDADGKPSYKPLTHGNYCWHTDKSYHAKPSLATLLHAIELPTEGGNTQFAGSCTCVQQHGTRVHDPGWGPNIGGVRRHRCIMIPRTLLMVSAWSGVV